jgi:hypothetical protein
LGLRHPLGGAAQPVRRLLHVGLGTDALVEAEPEIERGDQITGGGSLLEPMRDPSPVLRTAGAIEHEIGKINVFVERSNFRHSQILGTQMCDARVIIVTT